LLIAKLIGYTLLSESKLVGNSGRIGNAIVPTCLQMVLSGVDNSRAFRLRQEGAHLKVRKQRQWKESLQIKGVLREQCLVVRERNIF
jgi:hypothetical protein